MRISDAFVATVRYLAGVHDALAEVEHAEEDLQNYAGPSQRLPSQSQVNAAAIAIATPHAEPRLTVSVFRLADYITACRGHATEKRPSTNMETLQISRRLEGARRQGRAPNDLKHDRVMWESRGLRWFETQANRARRKK